MTNMINPATQNESAEVAASYDGPTQFTVQVGSMAHGGHCIAQYEGRVVFVRHAIPGETVVAKLTGVGPSGRYLLADTVQVVLASEFRRAHQWKLADSQRAYAAGRQPIVGAEYGHIVMEYQHRLKANVFRDTMVNLGKQDVDDMEISVQGLEDESAGLRWRTRHSFVVSAAGRLSKPVHRSLKSVLVRLVPVAVPQLNDLELWNIDFSGAARVDVATPGHGRDALISIIPQIPIASSEQTLAKYVDTWRTEMSDLPAYVSAQVLAVSDTPGHKTQNVQLRGRSWVHEEVAPKTLEPQNFQVSHHGAWPVHRNGPATLVDAVVKAADLQPGQVVAELYAGAGLYSRFLAEVVGPDGAVLAVEPRKTAGADANANLQEVPQATVFNGKINRVLAGWVAAPDAELAEGGLNGQQVDVVVVNAPRKGARGTILSRVNELDPNKIVYVTKYPPSLARDTRWLNNRGWTLESVDAHDLGPDTEHLDTICVFTKQAD